MFIVWLLCQTVYAQSRPVLLQPKRDFLAGRLVLIPANAQPDALAIPRQLAQICDHELRTPPVNLLASDQTDSLNEWVRKFDFAETDGLLVAIDKLGPAAAATLQTIRSTYRHLHIYGFAQSNIAQTERAKTLLAAGTLDFLLITAPSASKNANASRLSALDTNNALASRILLARFLNQRFGFIPPVATLFSGNSGRALTTEIAGNIAALNGGAVAFNAPAATAGLRLIVHTPQTTEAERGLLISAIATMTAGGARIALVDANDNAEDRAALWRALRERKLLDRLAGYATVSAQAPSFNEACQRALTQANLWLIALNFLRDDTERVRRSERSQIAALLSAYLREAVLPALPIPALETATTPEQRPEQREARVLAALKPAAETLFNEQFRRNVHALLLNTGERVEFEIRLLQRLQVRWPEAAATPEIRTDIHIVLLGTMLATPGLPRAGWELENAAGIDQRIRQRFETIAWQSFKMDAPNVGIAIRLAKTTPSESATAQGYSINSRRGGDTRRITVNAASPQGAFYALAHLEQLGASGQLAQDAQWTEKPALAERGFTESANNAWSHRERLEILRWAGRARLNTFILEPAANNVSAGLNTGLNTEQWRELNAVARQNFITPVISIKFDESARQDQERAFAELTGQIKPLARLGFERFALQQETADEGLTRRLQSWLAANYPGSSLAPVARWRWLLCPATALQSWALPTAALPDGNLILCVTDGPRLAVLPLAWFGAHTWSGKSFNPTQALPVTLAWLYDEKARAAISSWLTTWRGDSPTSLTTVLAPLFDADAAEVNVPALVETLTQLQTTLPQLNTTREQGLLRGELLSFLQDAQQHLERLQTDPRYERTTSGSYRRRIQ